MPSPASISSMVNRSTDFQTPPYKKRPYLFFVRKTDFAVLCAVLGISVKLFHKSDTSLITFIAPVPFSRYSITTLKCQCKLC